MLKKTKMNQSKLFAGLTGVAALALVTACSAEEPAPDEQPADQQTEQQEATTPADSPDTATTEPTETTEDTGNDATESPASGGDEVYSIIEAVESEYSGGFIVDIDRDDEGSMYEVDVVADNEVYQLDVSADGTINVDETDTDEDDIREAEQASVPVTEALDEAFNQHPDSTFDQIQLDEDDGSIHWEIDLDDANGSEVELNVPAA
ncbi:MAG: hypothetical protein HLX51_03925 [Micrococcaceae bacterium]|nr:hypothetical protein [Micrococcaceae bacterium]